MPYKRLSRFSWTFSIPQIFAVLTKMEFFNSHRPYRRRTLSVIESRVENRRSNCSLPVVNRLGFRLVTSVRFGLVLFPVPAHRTGQAVFPHPALGKDSRFRPRKVRGPVW